MGLRDWLPWRKRELVSVGGAHGWHTILEPFTGAWQRGKTLKQGDILSYPTLYACVARIVQDIGAMAFEFQRRDGDIWKTADSAAFSPVLRKPNAWQTAGQFREHWAMSKLMHGNTYVLKRRDDRQVVRAMYVLDPHRVAPMVTDAGEVWYQLSIDRLSTLPRDYPAEQLLVPASEIIHDRHVPLFHPLVGLPPVTASAMATRKNWRILQSADEFFANNSRISGILTAPAGIGDSQLQKLREYWRENMTGDQAGGVGVIGSDMKFTPLAINSVDAQVVEQLKYSDEQICQPFGIPPYKIGIGTVPDALGLDGLNKLYFADALRAHIEHMEALVGEGLTLPRNMRVRMNTDVLLRMDIDAMSAVESTLVKAKIKTPDEARAKFDLPPVDGGETLWGQAQDYPLGYLAQRRAPDAISVTDPVPGTEESPDIEEVGRMIAALLERELNHVCHV